MNRRTLRHTPACVLVAALLTGPAQAASDSSAASIDRWVAVPDSELARLRGGIDLGSAIAHFAIERLVRIDGVVVARTQLVITGLERLASGVLPDIHLAGNLANLVQIGQGNALADLVGIDPASLASDPAAAPASGATGTASGTNLASGSMARFGDALARGVQTAAGSASGAGAPAAVPATAPPAGAATAPPAVPAAGAAASVARSITVPVGNTGQVIVVTAIPDASTLSTSIQNSVQATRIETQTSIDATLNSLSALRSADFAASLRQQAIDSIRR